MKLRRAMAAAAATAVIAPLALLSAPAAFATDGPSTTTTTTEPTAPTTDPTAPTTDPTAPTTDPTTPTTDPTTPATDPTAPTTDPTAPTTDPTAPTTEPTDSPSPSESAPEDGDEAELCVDEDGNDLTGLSADLKSGLSGLPDTIVSGSGWTKFSFNVSNNGDDEIKDIAPMIGVAAFGWDDAEDYSGEISVQVLDKATGTWQEVAGAAGEGGTFTPFSLGAGKSTSYQLRLSVSGKVPDSIGVTGGFAQYSDDEGCWVADDPNGWVYFFDILAAGSDPGKPSEAKPQTGGKKEITQAKTVDVSGSLAETGSSSALPMIGLVGGVAVVAGAGAVFVVRRRKTGADA
ncbi:LAETG motif-containing sortase-dependent surface protein [Streptomyces sp. NBC_00286]|uniref:LAETG motif-containing sortase-dependent surface protein n=1 Tax=Streptomyces sp. NBC_00286 TaxID=2975701 RepID=UPI002E2BB175|nr:LAETG motif-containing sortase-dependent surface protein [Streptomyces sp. NBC_00286]